jgi:outer membrane protein assembly factor BamB
VAADGKLILFHRVKTEEVVEAMDLKSGATVWRYAYPTNYRDDFGFDEGPRAVPVVVGGVVYTFGAQGQLHAVGLADGKKRWSEDTVALQGGQGLLRRSRLAAGRGRSRHRERRRQGCRASWFDAATGKVLWMATDDEASYSSPVGATIGGRRLAVFLTRSTLMGVDPATGRSRSGVPGAPATPTRSTPHPRSLSAIRSSSRRSTGPARGCFVWKGPTWWTYGPGSTA